MTRRGLVELEAGRRLTSAASRGAERAAGCRSSVPSASRRLRAAVRWRPRSAVGLCSPCSASFLNRRIHRPVTRLRAHAAHPLVVAFSRDQTDPSSQPTAARALLSVAEANIGDASTSAADEGQPAELLSRPNGEDAVTNHSASDPASTRHRDRDLVVRSKWRLSRVDEHPDAGTPFGRGNSGRLMGSGTCSA